jgi:hypothetical protein
MSRQIKTTPLFNNLDDQIIINQEDSEEELMQVMKEFCATIGEKFYKFKFDFQKSEQILQKNYYTPFLISIVDYYLSSKLSKISLFILYL